MKTMNVEAIVLAAGKSSRMGTNKLLLDIGGKKVIDHILESLKPIPTIVVLGHLPNDLKNFAELHGATTVLNEEYELGMTSSFQTGLRAVHDDTEAVFMALGDTFGFKHEVLKRMMEVLEDDPDAVIVSPVFDGKRGHPVLFRRKIFDEFLKLGENQTMKDVVTRHTAHHRLVDAERWVTIDMDTPEDLEGIRKLWQVR